MICNNGDLLDKWETLPRTSCDCMPRARTKIHLSITQHGSARHGFPTIPKRLVCLHSPWACNLLLVITRIVCSARVCAMQFVQHDQALPEARWRYCIGECLQREGHACAAQMCKVGARITYQPPGEEEAASIVSSRLWEYLFGLYS